ncbi:MAG: tRNA (cytidine(56)-2'-O)-methyltransferase [Candidatus Aenigmarchaeota archaeon]|nr:tRNA (cytidine(56)-2'-O)-methyltransferase [Candidatus Aenigmarchaeota archaeon]
MITVLRLGHRLGRDDRISTHCGLVARALGADSIIYTGEKDDKMIESVKDVTERFGGKFSVGYEESFKKVIRNYKKRHFSVVHLTVYGLPIQKKIKKIRSSKKVLVIIGGEKVPPAVYHLADYNISVSSQPHSEVASLAVFLHDYFRGKELEKKFNKAKIRILPAERGKKVIEKR